MCDVSGRVPPSHLLVVASSSMWWTCCCTILSRSWSDAFSDRTSSSRVLQPSDQQIRDQFCPHTPTLLLQKVPFTDFKDSNLSLLQPDFLCRCLNVIYIYKNVPIHTPTQVIFKSQTNLAEVFVSALNICLKQTDPKSVFLCIQGEQITSMVSFSDVRQDDVIL